MGKPAWNKGKSYHAGKEHHLFGKHHTEKSRKKMSDSHKGQIPWNTGKKGVITPWNKGKAYLQIRGDKHPFWNGGSSFFPYCPKFNEILKEKIRERDSRICQLCGCTEEENGQKLSVHHVHYDKPNCNPDLIALCNRCNLKVNSNRDYYETLFMKQLENRGFATWCS